MAGDGVGVDAEGAATTFEAMAAAAAATLLSCAKDMGWRRRKRDQHTGQRPSEKPGPVGFDHRLSPVLCIINSSAVAFTH